MSPAARALMYHVICKEDKGWGLHRIAAAWAEALECGLSKTADKEAAVNLWVGFSYFGQEAKHNRAGKYNAVLFTHRLPGVHKGWDRAAHFADLCLCQSRRHLGHLPPHKTVVFRPGFHRQFDSGRQMRFLVVMATHKASTGEPIDRKRFDWFRHLSGLGLGEWWITAGKYPFHELPGLIDECDYVVVLSDLEGGPLAIQEALARHKPVIAPDVGFCWEWPVVRFTGLQELESIIRKLCRACDYDQEGDIPLGRQLKCILHRELRQCRK